MKNYEHGLAGLAVGNVTGEPNTLPLLEKKKQQRERARERERQRDSCSHVGSSHFGSRRESERERERVTEIYISVSSKFWK